MLSFNHFILPKHIKNNQQHRYLKPIINIFILYIDKNPYIIYNFKTFWEGASTEKYKQGHFLM